MICRPLFTAISWEAPLVTEAMLVDAFKRVPGTRNPGVLPETQSLRLLNQLQVDVPTSAP